MALLTRLNNPFNPRDKETYEIGHGVALFYYLNSEEEDIEFVVSLNGIIIEDYSRVLKEEDHIAFVAIPKGGGGGGSDPIRTIAMIALVVAAPMVAPAMLGAMGIAATSLTVGLMQAGLVMVGGMLINTLLPPPTASLGTNSSLDNVSPTYAFSGGSNAREAGTSLPIIIGVARVTPPIIGSYLSLDGDKQHLNVLMAVNDGELDNIEDVEINGQPIDNFNDVTYSITRGTPNQTVIGNFRDSSTTASLSRNLNTEGVETTYTTAGNSIQELEVVMLFPKGLFYVQDSGAYVNESVTLRIEYKKTTDANYIIAYDETVIATYKTAKRLAYSIKNLDKAQYDVRVTRVSAYSTDTRAANDLTLDYVNEVVYDDFIYPSVALLSVNAIATDQLNGNFPTITCKCSNIGTIKPKDNPAWACYDLLKRDGIDDINIDLVKFQEWADYCDTKNLKVGLYLDSQQELQSALNMVSLLGRATVVQFGSTFAPIVDKAVNIPTQSFLFTSGNIIDSSFSLDYIPYNERSNIVEVTYYDKTDGYKAKTIQLQSHDFDSTSVEKKSSISLYGCVDRQQAADYAQFLLNNNRYITETVSFTASIDAIACGVGDVIKVGKKYMTNTQADGRIVDATPTTIILDHEVSLIADEFYEIQFRLETDEIITVDVPPVTVDTLTDTLEVSTMVNVPSKFDVYAFGLQSTEAINLYRVVNISRDSDLKRKIKAVEYNPDVYSDSAVINVEEVVFVDDIRNLQVHEMMVKNIDGSIDEILTLSWIGDNILASIYVDNVKYGVAESNSFVFKNELIAGRTYTFKVGNQELIHKFLGESAPPPAPTKFFVDFQDDNNLKLSWSIDSEPVDFKGYQLRLGYTKDWAIATPLVETTQKTITVKSPKLQQFMILLKSVDLKGNLSLETRFIEFNLGDDLVNNLVYTRVADFVSDANINFIVNGSTYETIDNGVMYYKQNADYFYSDYSLDTMYEPKYDGAYIISRFTPDTSGKIIPEFDGAGSPIYYIRRYYTSQFYTSLDSDMYDDLTAEVYQLDDFALFTDFDAMFDNTYEMMAKFATSADKTVINEISYKIDAPDIIERFNDVVISPIGTYVIPNQKMNTLKNVNLTLQDDGGMAVTAKVMSKNVVNGALIEAYDGNGARTSAIIDLTLQGY